MRDRSHPIPATLTRSPRLGEIAGSDIDLVLRCAATRLLEPDTRLYSWDQRAAREW